MKLWDYLLSNKRLSNPSRSVFELDRCDFALIDADKELYPTYYEQALTLVRPGGVIAIDNTLWRGTVVDPAATKPKTETFRSFNAFIHADERVTQVMLPRGAGRNSM